MSALKPFIKSPVSRHLVVQNIAESIDFYITKLGFEAADNAVGEMPYPAVVNGPARIYFHTNTGAVDSTGPLRPAGSAMVFFEVGNVNDFYEWLRQNGLQPREPERLNWIKMEVMELTDPDGHRLWFGKSFHENMPEAMHTPSGTGQMRQIMPVYPCSDVTTAVLYYQQVMGFGVNYQQDDLGVLDRDNVRLLLVAKTQHEPGPGSCCVYIRDADELYQELKTQGAELLGEPVSYPWGLREFVAIDPDGNRTSFAQTFE